jgi:hypothetical protein
MAATGHRDRDADLAVETLVTDSVTNAPLAMSVRDAQGVIVPNSKTPVTLDTLKPTIDNWMANVSDFVQKLMK